MAHALNGHGPIWFYNFDYRGKNTYGDRFALTTDNINFNWGVCHCDDLLYLFKSPHYFEDIVDMDKDLSEIMVSMWTDFAIFRWVN